MRQSIAEDEENLGDVMQMMQMEMEGEEVGADSMEVHQKLVESLEVQKKEFKELFGEEFATFSNMIEFEGDNGTAAFPWNKLSNTEADEFKQELMEDSAYAKQQAEFPQEENDFGLFDTTNPLQR